MALDPTLATAVTTPLTRRRVHAQQLLDERWIVDDPAALMTVVRQMVTERNRTEEQIK